MNIHFTYFTRLVIIIILLSFCSCANESSLTDSSHAVKNVILILGDNGDINMIQDQIISENRKLNLLQVDEIGYTFNSSGNSLLDPGAAATAIAIGQNANNKSLGVDQKNLAHPNLVELASVNGLSTAVVSRTSIANPVSAAFLVHGNNLCEPHSIALEILNSPVDIIIGCGLESFSGRKDSMDLMGRFQKKGFNLSIHSKQNMNPSKFALLNANNMCGKKDTLYTFQNSFDFALKFLQKNPKGFLLIVDATISKNNQAVKEADFNSLNSGLVLDGIIGQSFKYAKDNAGTLVIVLSMNNSINESLHNIDINSNEQAVSMKPVFSFGSESELYGGIFERTAIFEKVVHSLKLSDKQRFKEKGTESY
jgi:alkaline phosphatase